MERLIIKTKCNSEHDVAERRRAAVEWCRHATAHAIGNAGKPWRYVLVPHDVVNESMTLPGLIAQYVSTGYQN